MKTAARLLIALALAALAAPAAFAETPPTKALGTQKLPAQLKIDPNTLKAIHLAPPPSAADEVDAALASVKTAAEGVRSARSSYEGHEKTCASRSYSSQDMHDAGCTDADTVGACTAKLYRSCMRQSTAEYRRRAFLFQRGVQVLDQKAHALAFPPETP